MLTVSRISDVLVSYLGSVAHPLSIHIEFIFMDSLGEVDNCVEVSMAKMWS